MYLLYCLFFSHIFVDIPNVASAKVNENSNEDEFGAKDYRRILELKLDHESRPLWVVGI